ncbi:methyltransferase domain-containing protein [Rhizobium deserti]|uniref:Methyltransferase domain-containing protein n=1 Tax=Rhizobium deserti TaxID=2547961 RepID=A0A4R5UMN8_9HYPH|nr:class I SAM-dependent methyltransferase [Rhizobium deserti]TDK39143.1 methyltransferase domain-containing protein [Rhizobium deserti]
MTISVPRRQTACRHCSSPLSTVFADLGATPVSNDYLTEETRFEGERFYPLKAFVCDECHLVQLEDFRRADDLFREDYAYFSSISTSWLAHAKIFSDAMISRLGLGADSTVVEVASNDGYLLQYFQASGLRVLGVEPCRSVADFAINEKGIPTRIEFFGVETAKKLVAEGFQADLTAANNVLAHVPDINDFVSGFREILKPDGVACFEFPHLFQLINQNQFDTIYHEHFSYLSLLSVQRFFAANGLTVFDVEKIKTHGGSLRVFACKAGAKWEVAPSVADIIEEERQAGLDRPEVYTSFGEKVRETKRSLLELLISLKRDGKVIVGYGAPAKGNTLLNYCGIGSDFIEFTVDRSPQKQGMYLPGTRLAIKAPEAIDEAKPDFVLILPWNIKDEVVEQMSHIRDWGGQFILPIPKAMII